MSIELMDVTLREVGYVNGCDLEEHSAARLVEALDRAGIELAEVGYYRSNAARHDRSSAHPPSLTLEHLECLARRAEHLRLAVMVHPRDVATADYSAIADCGVSVVRIAIDHHCDFDVLKHHVDAAKQCGMLASVNLTRISELSVDEVSSLGTGVERSGADWFYVADSNGALFPRRVREIATRLVDELHLPLGFHPHDGLRLAFANALEALDAGFTLVDGSLLGMGKGGGNLFTELMAIYLNHTASRRYAIENLVVAASMLPEQVVQHHRERQHEAMMSSILDLNLGKIADYVDEARSQGVSPLHLLSQMLGDAAATDEAPIAWESHST